jgi:hypothetical protein
MNAFGVSSAIPFPKFMFNDLPEVNLIFRKIHRHGGNDDPYVVLAGDKVDMDRANRYDYALEYIQSWAEYRVHVFNGKVLRVQRKRKQNGVEHDQYIRNADRGWVLVEEEDPKFSKPSYVQPAIDAVKALGLVFGAADVLRGKKGTDYYKTSTVIEVNTAPGLNEDGVLKYAEAFLDYHRNPAEPEEATVEAETEGEE